MKNPNSKESIRSLQRQLQGEQGGTYPEGGGPSATPELGADGDRGGLDGGGAVRYGTRPDFSRHHESLSDAPAGAY